jgi:hypothetical protein
MRKMKIRQEILGPNTDKSIYPCVLADTDRTIVTQEEMMQKMPYVKVLHIPATNPRNESYSGPKRS